LFYSFTPSLTVFYTIVEIAVIIFGDHFLKNYFLERFLLGNFIC